MSDRVKGKKVLETVLKDKKKITQVEKYIYEKTTGDSEKYDTYIYQVVGDIMEGVPIGDIYKTSYDPWKHSTWEEMAIGIQEQNEFITNPFEVEEGVFECRAIDPLTGKICGSKRVFSYTKQDRSCDEGTSVYCQCTKCKSKWRERG
jgi:DNA-directed RNA polymerase subunit M/transcription elongation factor TFIIS